MRKVNMKKAGYEHVSFDHQKRMHLLKNMETGSIEAWTANKNHASYGLIYKNTHLEFCHTLK